MKEFFERRKIGLEVEDAGRYARILLGDLNSVLPDWVFVLTLFDTPEWEARLGLEVKEAVRKNKAWWNAASGELHLPLIYQGRPLALVTATPPQGEKPPPGAFPYLTSLIRLSLEKIHLHKITVTDEETGLYNADYFQAYLGRNLAAPARLGPGLPGPKSLQLRDKEEHPGLSVLLAEVLDFDKLMANFGRLAAVRVLKIAAGWLKSGAGPSCLARLGPGRLGLVMTQRNPQAALDLAKKTAGLPETEPRDWPKFELAVGLAEYPGDFGEDLTKEDPAGTREGSLARLILNRAEQALFQAVNDKDNHLFTYRDVLERGGRVVQSLPYNRVVVNLGRIAGAREGQVFVISRGNRSDEADYKGEVALFDVREDFSLGEVILLKDSLSLVQPGDVLTLSRTSPEEFKTGTAGEQVHRDPLLGLPDHAGFLKLLSDAMAGTDRFAVILLRVDGYDRFRSTMGHLESDRQLKALFDLIRAGIPGSCLVGRFSADSLAAYCPGLDEAGALDLAGTWREVVLSRHRQTASFGLAVYPCGPFNREDVIHNAQKALEHASFLGQASIAAFEAVSLNISGDKLFEAGDLDGAVEEYQKALELDPEDINVLNSLGVCYGHLHKSHKALETFARALELAPDNLMAWHNRGFVLAMEGNTLEAYKSFKAAAEIDGQNFDVLFYLGKTALELDLMDEALAVFQKAADLESCRPIVFRYLGQTLLKAEKRQEAIEAFKAAVRFDPEDAPSLSQLGVLFLERGTDLEVALSLIRQSVNLDGSNSLFRQRLARALAEAGELEEAEKEYLQALEMGARSREVYYELGRLAQGQGKLAEAAKWFQESLKLDPGFKPAAEAWESLPAQS